MEANQLLKSKEEEKEGDEIGKKGHSRQKLKNHIQQRTHRHFQLQGMKITPNMVKETE